MDRRTIKELRQQCDSLYGDLSHCLIEFLKLMKKLEELEAHKESDN